VILAARSLVDLLAQRREAEAARFLRTYSEKQPFLATYAGLCEAALEEAASRGGRGELTDAQLSFVDEAIERIMSTAAPALMAVPATRGSALCAGFDSEGRCPRLAVAAALLTLGGYDVCQPLAESPVEDLKRIVDEIEPAVCVFSADSTKARAALARVVAYLRGKKMVDRPFIVVVAGQSAGALACNGLDVDVVTRSAKEAVDAVLRLRNGALERRA
jgi:hypothetical protein